MKLLSKLALSLLIFFSVPTFAYAATYYVSTNGTDTNAGTLTAPLKTIQACLNKVAPGDTCLVQAGTYNEALSIKTSGTSSGVISIQNYNGGTATVNSGSAKTIQMTGDMSYYTIDGLRLISTKTGGQMADTTIDFANTASGGYVYGNNITLKNCYIEGAVFFRGSNDMVDTCELNGRNTSNDGIRFTYPTSSNDIVQNSKIHDYTGRALWTENATTGTIFRNNTVYNTVMGIDCDGAYNPVHNCQVIKNTIYNIAGPSQSGWGCGVFLENAFNAVVDRNLIYNLGGGNAMYIINYGAGDTSDGSEYRDKDLNAVVTNNVVYNNIVASNVTHVMLEKSASGIQFLNNTFAVPNAPNWVKIFEFEDGNNTTIHTQHLTFRNNIFTGSGGTIAMYAVNTVTFTSSLFSNNLYYGRTPGTGETGYITSNPLFVGATDFHLQSSSPAIDKGTTVAVTTDFDGVTRPQGAGFDIGAYEFVSGGTPTTPTPLSSPSPTLQPTPPPLSTNTPTPTPKPTNTPTPTPTIKPGDANGDGKVDETDYGIWLSYFGQMVTGGRTVGDFNSNGIVDGLDYVLWLSNYSP